MRGPWVGTAFVLALGCGDDSPRGAPLPGDLDASVVDAGSDASRDAPSDASPIARDAATTSVCPPKLEVIPVTKPAYHREGVIDYADPPPVGGDHNPCWGEWKVYDAKAPLRVENWVHNLEHGGVVYLYNCPDGCDAEVSELARFVKGRTQSLLTAYAALPTRFAVVSWGVRLTSDCFDRASFEQFYDAHVDMGTEHITSGPPDSCL